MAEIKWIKLSTDMFNDEKTKLIEKMPEADTIIVIWMKLLVQAGKNNASGHIYLSENIPYTDEMLATIFDRPVNTVRFALETFKNLNMIEVDEENFISVSNWEKHQNIEGMEKVRNQTRQRVAEHRKRKKLASNGDVTNDVTLHVTQSNATDIDKKENKNKKENKDIKNSHESGKQGESEADFSDSHKKPSQKHIFDDNHMKLAKLLFKKMQENNPKVKQPNFESWADTFRKMIKLDKQTGKDIQDVILWCQQHHFWHTNILSAATLRKQFDRLLLQMKDESKDKDPSSMTAQERKNAIDARYKQQERKEGAGDESDSREEQFDLNQISDSDIGF